MMKLTPAASSDQVTGRARVSECNLACPVYGQGNAIPCELMRGQGDEKN